jgi:nitrogenase molybdenum-iron protein alpha/beta subunit
MSVYDDVKKALQDLLAPELKEMKGEMKVVNIRLEAMDKTINQRFDDLLEKLELSKRIEKLEQERNEKRAS